MDDRSLKLTEAWFRLLAEGARGTRAARETIRSLTSRRLDPEELARAIARFLPSGVSPPSPAAINEWMEGLWSATGVVPRARYLELLERYEALRARLEEAEVTIQKLRRLLGEKGHEGDAQKLLDIWANAVGDTLRTQAEWMRSWIPQVPDGAHERPKETAHSTREPAARKASRPERRHHHPAKRKHPG